jgi:Amt family ammonium transporter
LAYSYILGKRTGHGTHTLNYRPHNVSHIVIGTVFLWVGWFGFNAGSALSANLRAVMAAMVTNLAACVGGVTWCLVDYRLEKKWSTVGFCSGVISGLVCVTPGSGFIPAWAAVVYGLTAGIGCNFATQLKYYVDVDDALDIFAVHGIGGLLGNLLTGFFAADYIAHLDGVTVIPGGWLNRHWVQLAIQLADSVTGMAYSFAMTCLILLSMSFLSRWLPSMRLRASAAEEEMGIDDAELGEFAYDYVELVREVKPERDHDENNENDDDVGTAGTLAGDDGPSVRSARSTSRGSQMRLHSQPVQGKDDYPMGELERAPRSSSADTSS